MVKDYIHGAYHKELADEINRVLLNCEKNGIFINKKNASAIVAEKSKKGKMTLVEIKEYVKRLRKITDE